MLLNNSVLNIIGCHPANAREAYRLERKDASPWATLKQACD